VHVHFYKGLLFRFIISGSSGYFTEAIASSNTSAIDYHLCDGDWHDVVLRKSDSRIFIEVDDVMYSNITSFLSQMSSFTQFYVGGLPSDVMRGMMGLFDDDARPFGGCMRRFAIGDRNVNLSHDVIMVYNVDLDGCPIGASNSRSRTSSFEESAEGSGIDSLSGDRSQQTNISCMDNNIDTLYNGMDHSYTDSAIDHFFSRYLYKVSMRSLCNGL